MPEREYRHAFIGNATVDVVPDSREIESAKVGISWRIGTSAYARLPGQQILGLLEVVSDCARREGSILGPPSRGAFELPERWSGDLDGQHPS
jgi:hypothetical protein